MDAHAADGALQHFEVATFVTMVDGMIHEITELWTDVDNAPSTAARPASGT